MAMSFGQFATYEVLRRGFEEVLPTENGRRLFHWRTKRRGVRTTIVLIILSLIRRPHPGRWTTRQHASRVGAHRHAAACRLQACETGDGIRAIEYAAPSHQGKQPSVVRVAARLTARLR